MTSPVSQEDTRRFLEEIVRAAGSDGLSNDDMEKAFSEFVELNVSHAMIELWRRGEMKMSWSVAQQDLIMRLTESDDSVEPATTV